MYMNLLPRPLSRCVVEGSVMRIPSGVLSLPQVESGGAAYHDMWNFGSGQAVGKSHTQLQNFFHVLNQRGGSLREGMKGEKR